MQSTGDTRTESIRTGGGSWLPKYKRRVSGRGPLVEASIKVKRKDGSDVYAIQVSNLKRTDFEDAAEPTRWARYVVNQHWDMIATKATRKTGFTEVGEVVCMLKSRDGRKMRLRLNDFTIRDFCRVSKILTQVYGKENKKRRR